MKKTLISGLKGLIIGIIFVLIVSLEWYLFSFNNLAGVIGLCIIIPTFIGFILPSISEVEESLTDDSKDTK